MNPGKNIFLNLKNIPGRRINGKVLVIECDDWGGIRMPSKKTYTELLRAGIPVDRSRFDKYDTLADKNDLELLFEVLLSVKDANGNGAAMTPVINVANPDFRKIKDSEFEHYYYEPFTDTLIRHGRHSDTFLLWKKGIENGIFVPEFHGREHISVQYWLQKLREGNKKLRLAFDHEYVNVPIGGLHKSVQDFRPGFFIGAPDHIDFLKDSITEGVKLFSKILDYHPCSFAPGNGIFHPVLEKTLSDNGIKFMYASHIGIVPDLKGNIKPKFNTMGKKNFSGLTYYSRNCGFEPTDPGYLGIDLTISQIDAAFRWGKPAIISTHRANFVGGIEISNRDQGLKELKCLLNTIVKKWPEIEFMSSSKMLGMLYPES